MEPNHVYVKAARKLFNECDKIDGELKGYILGKGNRDAKFQEMVA